MIVPFVADHAGFVVCEKIQEYIKRQLDEDKAGEQLTMGNYQTRLRAGSNSPSQLADRTNVT